MSIITLPEMQRHCPNCHSLHHFMEDVEIPFTCPKCGTILAMKLVVDEPQEETSIRVHGGKCEDLDTGLREILKPPTLNVEDQKG
ncbi:MAG: hypothetical protein ABIJ47_10905 [Candidatus Bathyarchaeota archaeon]